MSELFSKAPEETSPWVTTSSRLAYQNPWLKVREDQVIRPDGGPGLYGVVEIRPSIGVVAIDSEDRVVLVGQWRYAVDRYSWEIPRGGSQEGETDMQAVAARELAEEAGVTAAEWRALGPVDVCNGVANDVQSLFLAKGLTATERHLDPEEEIEIRWVPFEEAVEMAVDGRITEVCSVAGLLRVALLRRRDER